MLEQEGRGTCLCEQLRCICPYIASPEKISIPTGPSGSVVLVQLKFCLGAWNFGYCSLCHFFLGNSFFCILSFHDVLFFKSPHLSPAFTSFWYVFHFLRFFASQHLGSVWNLLLPWSRQAHKHMTVYLKAERSNKEFGEGQELRCKWSVSMQMTLSKMP